MKMTERISFISSVGKIFGMNNKQIRPKKLSKNKGYAVYGKIEGIFMKQKKI